MRILNVFIISLFLIFYAQAVQACEFCTLAYLGKPDSPTAVQEHTWSTKVFYEYQNWDEIPAVDAHELHHQGHHTHDKQDEEILHLMIGKKITERLNFDLDVPYVTRRYIEIDSHARLGRNEISRGLGDITLTGDYRLIQAAERSFGVITGIKLPSGETNQLDSGEAVREPELQPGTGSVDYLAGFSGSLHPGVMDFSASAIYVYKTQGAQDFRFGDVLSVSFFAGRRFELKDKWQIRTGLMLNHQLEKKQNDDSGYIKDSGGYTIFAGPEVGLDYDAVSVEFSYLVPVVQELGGVHQELNGIWTGAVGVRF